MRGDAVSAAEQAPQRKGGPEKCERPCLECQDADHHFADPMIGVALEDPTHEAAQVGCETWWECKHCPAWREVAVGDFAEPDDDTEDTEPG